MILLVNTHPAVPFGAGLKPVWYKNGPIYFFNFLFF